MLYIVATPIGNLEEITYRAVNILKSVDTILCEDTRHSKILLDHYGIEKPLLSYEKFNEKARTAHVIEMLKSGKDIALISDAGMPVVCDPGSILIKEVVACGLEFTAVSGACAAVNALVLSGLDTAQFTFCGFLPPKMKERDELLNRFKDCRTTLIFYLPPSDVIADLNYLFTRLGKRKFSLAREITKKFEEVVRGELGALPKITIKGEFVAVIEGGEVVNPLNALSVEEHLTHYVAKGYTNTGAVKQVAKDRDVKKNEIYVVAMSLFKNLDL